MKKKLLNYTNRIDRLLKSESQDTDWNAIREDHLIQIGFFQHERLVHLIVTVSFGLFLALIANLLFAADDFYTFLGVLILFLLIAVTLVFYIFHYFSLENNVQKLYDQYDEILRKKSHC